MHRWKMRYLDGGGAGGGIPERNLNDAKELVQTVADLRTVVLELHGREKGGRIVTQDEWTKVDDGLKSLSTKIEAQQAIISANASRFSGVEDDRVLIQRAAMKLQVPEDVKGLDRTYYNLMALHPEELIAASTLGHRGIPGMRRSVAEFARNNKYAHTVAIIEEAQRKNDELLFLDALLYGKGNTPYAHSGGTPGERMRGLNAWQDYARIMGVIFGERGLNETNAADGGRLVPQVLSATLLDQVILALKVAALFPQLTMIRKTLEWPVLGGAATAYLVPEATGEGTNTPSGAQITASTLAFNLPKWTAQKLADLIVVSSELDEDSLVPVIPFIQGHMVDVLSRGIEDAMINGESGGSTMDGATFNPANGAKRAWKGLRYYALMTASYTAAVDMGNATATESKTWDVQLAMGNFGATPSKLAIIVGHRGLKSYMKMTSVLTLEKYGPGASILNGEIGNLMGSPIILSQYVVDLNAAGKFDGTTTNRGSAIQVYRDAFGFGQRRVAQVKRSDERYIETDQTVLQCTWRGDFEPFYTPVGASVQPVGLLYDIA